MLLSSAGDALALLVRHRDVEAQGLQARLGLLRPGAEDVGQRGERLDEVGVGSFGLTSGAGYDMINLDECLRWSSGQ